VNKNTQKRDNIECKNAYYYVKYFEKLTINRGIMFQTKRTIEFSMCDAAGILFFSRVFELFHSAYEEFIQTGDLEIDYFKFEKYAVPVLKIEADFKAPIRLHETLNIVIRVTQIKDSTFELTTDLVDEKGTTRATVKSVHIFVNINDFSKTNIPDDIRQILVANSH
jgi:YbgC/YbaW family acyl-CoA thioester hydrolase